MGCIYKRCGGCHYQNVDYKKELVEKKKYIDTLFANFKIVVNDVIGMRDACNYRHKTITTYKSVNNRTISGIYQEHTHDITKIEYCDIQCKGANDIIANINKFVSDLKIRPYDEDRRVGCLRHVMIRYSYHYSEAMVTLVTASEIFPGRNELVKKIIESCPTVKTIVQNTNSRSTSIVLGDKERVLYGQGFIHDMLCGYRFKISPKSFFQVNPEQTEKLYEYAISLAKLQKSDVVLDAYSGIGTISLAVSSKVSEVYAVEVVKEAVRDAIENAKINNVKNVRFFLDDATHFMKHAVSDKKIDVVFMDPPRSGSTKEFLDAVLKLRPRMIVYISCGPYSQVKDVRYLLNSKMYQIRCVQPIDMFPRTKHVETVALLELKNEEN